jgi:uncharacterized small protein (DUF1192 family)
VISALNILRINKMASEEDDFPILDISGRSFDEMSIDELMEYVDELTTEIEKVQKMIKKKEKASVAAESIFGKN